MAMLTTHMTEGNENEIRWWIERCELPSRHRQHVVILLCVLCVSAVRLQIRASHLAGTTAIKPTAYGVWSVVLSVNAPCLWYPESR